MSPPSRYRPTLDPSQAPDGPIPVDMDRISACRPGGIDRQVAAVAEGQHGVVSLAQLECLGLSETAVHRRVVAGRLHRAHQGVYAVGHALLTREGRFMAAALACGGDAVVSHRSAAHLWGLRQDHRGTIDVTAPRRRGRSPVDIDAHRDGSLRSVDRTLVLGIPCTSVARTLLDLAGIVSARELQNAITQAEIQRLFDLKALRELIDRSRGRRGVARLRLAISLHDPRDERAREGLERRFLALCRNAGLPSPEVNCPLAVDGVQMEADFLWRDAGLIVETDDRYSHHTITAFEGDRERDQRLKAAGWQVIRCTWRQVTGRSATLVSTLRLLLSQGTPPADGPES